MERAVCLFLEESVQTAACLVGVFDLEGCQCFNPSLVGFGVGPLVSCGATRKILFRKNNSAAVLEFERGGAKMKKKTKTKGKINDVEILETRHEHT